MDRRDRQDQRSPLARLSLRGRGGAHDPRASRLPAQGMGQTSSSTHAVVPTPRFSCRRAPGSPSPAASSTAIYHEDRFCRATLRIRNTEIGPSSLGVPILAVLNTADEIVPPASMMGFLDAIRDRHANVISYAGEPGVGLQHLALLVGCKAYDQVWPSVIAWLKALRKGPSTDPRGMGV